MCASFKKHLQDKIASSTVDELGEAVQEFYSVCACVCLCDGYTLSTCVYVCACVDHG